MSYSDVALSMFDDLVDDIGDSATINDGATSLPAVGGFFSLSFSTEQSERYGLTFGAPVYECRTDALAALDRSTLGGAMTLTVAGRSYRVSDIREDGVGLAVLVLSR